MSYPKCIVCYRAVGWIGLSANLAISVLKIVVGLVSGSHALMVDALYSAKDVVTSILIILGLRFAKEPIDEEHQFGHGKAEFLFSVVIGLSLIGVTGLILYFEAGKLIQGTHQAPHMIALWTAIFAVGANVMLTLYTRCVAFQINSPMVAVLTQHQRSDAIASAAVAVGIVGSHYLNMPWLDTLVAVGECIDLGYMGGEVFIHAVRGLMDVAAPEAVVTKIREIASRIPGVHQVETVQTRRVGQEIWVSLVIGVDPELSIREAKKVSRVVERNLYESIPHLGEVNVRFKSVNGSLPELDYLLRQGPLASRPGLEPPR
ncbi:Magnetosome protein MamM [Gammaproteobacteria bacterium]